MVMETCWEPCSLTSDKHMATVQWVSAGQTPVQMVSHLTRTNSPQDSVRICKTHAACRFFSLSFYCSFSEWFLVLLWQSHMQQL